MMTMTIVIATAMMKETDLESPQILSTPKVALAFSNCERHANQDTVVRQRCIPSCLAEELLPHEILAYSTNHACHS